MSTREMSDERVTAAVRDAAAAPSMHNTQPWRFRYLRSEGAFQVRADFGRALPHADPDGRALHISCGAALFNLRVALAHEGLRPVTRLLPDPDDPALLAVVRPAGPGDGEGGGSGGDGEDGIGALHPAVHRRHTSRRPFTGAEIPQALRTALSDAALREGALLDFPGPRHLRWVLELVEEAEARNRADRGEAEDLAHWTRTGAAATAGADAGGGAETAGDGIPEYAFGPRKFDGRAPVRDFAGTGRVAGRRSETFERQPQIALLSTVKDRPADWLRAGQAMERVLLLATGEGLVGSPATQPVEWPDLRWPLRDPVSGRGQVQMVLRLGYGPPGPATPRRPPGEVLDIGP
ncbi:Acg family FMN-binding oxidoreductase [Streptomyces chitinivorans]|uniref:Acg family FMN-binding oxidoreductase n=1 Tax=Streptomyces chitinivorans TaxID=1257027 RepID=A0ABW7HQ73_9ACTN|nr:nitroreductase [Streptomyces chitinivorans]MDH2411289.1 nitroreductase [Streptomyces chitinivorans]